MKNIFLLLSLLVCVSLTSCDKEEFNEFNRDNRPDIPVTFPGTTTYGFNPFITHSISGGGNIEFTMSIPENSGRTIREITKVIAGGTGIQAGALSPTSTAAAYNTAPIPGNGTTVTFTTTLEEFRARTPAATAALAVAGGEIAFMFLITLDNNEQIIPVQVRVRLVA